jgi:uncharacterized protein YebE (UPF0316 family)
MEKTKLNYCRIAIIAFCYIFFVTVRLIANFTQFLYSNVPWGSRLLAIASGLICFFLFRKYFENNNYFTVKQDKKGIGIVLTISIITVIGYTIIFFIRGQSLKFSIEELLFYSITVEIEEEIIFRGLLLGLLMDCLDKINKVRQHCT